MHEVYLDIYLFFFNFSTKAYVVSTHEKHFNEVFVQ